MDAFHFQDELSDDRDLRELPLAARRRLMRAGWQAMLELELSIQRGRPMTWPNLRRLLLRRMHEVVLQHQITPSQLSETIVRQTFGRVHDEYCMRTRTPRTP
jgi:hypothetical protein